MAASSSARIARAAAGKKPNYDDSMNNSDLYVDDGAAVERAVGKVVRGVAPLPQREALWRVHGHLRAEAGLLPHSPGTVLLDTVGHC